MKKLGTPKRDGSGKGTRSNKGRGGCAKPQRSGKGKQMADLFREAKLDGDYNVIAFESLTWAVIQIKGT